MRALEALRDPYGLAMVAATGIVLFVLQAGAIVAVVCALAVLAVRLGSEAVASWWLDRGRRRLLYGNWYDPLTHRQAEIALLVEEGLQYKEIAARLGITLAGVHSHIDHIKDALDLHGRDEVAAWVRERRSRYVAQQTPASVPR